MSDAHTSDGEARPNNQTTADKQIKAFVERIERLTEEKQTIADDIKDVFAEAKGNGFDVKILREVLRRRKMTKDERAEHDDTLAVYEDALGVFG